MPQPKLTLTYFPLAARAEPIRLAAAIGKISFTNKAVEFKDWKDIKDTTPLGQLPILEVKDDPSKEDKIVIPESSAILRYIGKLGGLYPEDPVQALQVDSFLETANDATKKIELSIMGPVKTLIAEEEWTNEEKMAFRKRIAENKQHGLPFHLSYFENALKKNEASGWLVGDTITIADIQVYRIGNWLQSGMLDGIPKEILNDYPKVKEHYHRIEALPKVAAWRSKYTAPYGSFDFEP